MDILAPLVLLVPLAGFLVNAPALDVVRLAVQVGHPHQAEAQRGDVRSGPTQAAGLHHVLLRSVANSRSLALWLPTLTRS